ncbi:hypothetical protein PUH89_10440 [Rhodobacter capsulatus]|uniref:O-antigen ligase like membrane protein n=1 Tax=Rhodobacter capsulatus TaxID=1061 RepID=A0A1G7J886_RHOCA|nr:hypothetical protein [Rhodobacter capsulatus]WER07763.1 hypothetical protein PUH89_10440 [Rhodobacter capsulatus]SDF21121.1 hypothetical protein SAMN04244550_01851 [Rhodobacter capsulatus]
MQFVSSTLFGLVLVIWALWRGPSGAVVALFAAIPFGMMAAINLPALGNTSLLASDLVVVTLAGMVLVRRGIARDLARLLAPRGAGIVLALFLAYAVFATLFYPRLFAGATQVFSLARAGNEAGIVSQPLAPGGGNLSQLLRMLLSTLLFFAVALVAVRRPEPQIVLRAMTAVTLCHAGLGLLDIATQATGTSFVLQPLRTANYALMLGNEMAGLNRLIGGFSEASSYGYVLIGLIGFWLGHVYHDRSGRRWPVALLALLGLLWLRSTSSSAYVGGILLLIVFALPRLFELTRRRRVGVPRRAALVVFGGLAALVLVLLVLGALYQTLPAVAQFLDRALLDKLSTQSAEERGSWDAQAYRNFLDTWMLGAGLGSVRASSWIAATLGTTGLIGLGLLLLFLWRLFRLRFDRADAARWQLAAALKLGMAGCLCRALVVKSSPNLDYIFLGMAGLLVGLWLGGRRPAAPRRRPQPGAKIR